MRVVDIPCEVVVERSEVPAELRCVALSIRGARIEAGVAPACGELVVLTFTPPSARAPLTFFARVRQVTRRGRAVRGFGVEFLDASPSDRAALREALAQVDATAADAA